MSSVAALGATRRFDGATLRFVSVAAESKVLNPWGIDPIETTETEYKGFEKIVKTINAAHSDACGAAFQVRPSSALHPA